jgi:hypothetical protein
MSSLPPHLHRLPAVLLIALAAVHAVAHAGPSSRAEMQPAPGVQLSYERLGPEDSATAPGRIDSSVATPAGTLRTTVRALPNEERSFQRGDTSFELPNRVLGGQLQLRGPEAGGTAAAWRAPLWTGLTANTQAERTPMRSGQALQLRQELEGGHTAQALLSNSKTATAQGSRWDLEVAEVTGLSRWTAGFEAAESSYVSTSGAREARNGLRLGTQWPLSAQSRMEMRYTRQKHWYSQDPVSSVMVGTRFDLPLRASLATAVETDADSHHKASLTLTVPLEAR